MPLLVQQQQKIHTTLNIYSPGYGQLQRQHKHTNVNFSPYTTFWWEKWGIFPFNTSYTLSSLSLSHSLSKFNTRCNWIKGLLIVIFLFHTHATVVDRFQRTWAQETEKERPPGENFYFINFNPKSIFFSLSYSSGCHLSTNDSIIIKRLIKLSTTIYFQSHSLLPIHRLLETLKTQ